MQSRVSVPGGRRRFLRTAAPAGIAWTVLLLSVLWNGLPKCRASEMPEGSNQCLSAASGLSYQSGVTADLDGDNHPDFAIVSPGVGGQPSYRYRIEIHLTTHMGPSSVSVTGEEGGLCLVARDVDGDGDLDLIVRSASSLMPVGVWINDGHGRFTEGDPTAYARSIWTEGPALLRVLKREIVQAAGPQSYHHWLALAPQRFISRTDLCSRGSKPLVSADTLDREVIRKFTRAPPSLSPEHFTAA